MCVLDMDVQARIPLSFAQHEVIPRLSLQVRIKDLTCNGRQ